jgi:hypothetical protein
LGLGLKLPNCGWSQRHLSKSNDRPELQAQTDPASIMCTIRVKP